MRYLIFIIAFFVAFYYSKQENTVEQEVEDIITGFDSIENAENIEELVKNTESFNKNATKNFEQTKKEAKSPASIQFVDLIEKQNVLAERGLVMTKEMQPLLNSLSPDLINDQEKLTNTLTPLCAILIEYIPVITEVVQIMNAKSELVHENPIIATELMGGRQDKAIEIMSHMADTQSRILEGEKQAYSQLNCDDYLLLN